MVEKVKTNPPYQVDEAIYKRFDAKNVIFSRTIWDTKYSNKVAQIRKVYENSDPGYSHLDSAFVAGAFFCGAYNGTFSPMLGLHTGLLSFESQTIDAPNGPVYPGRWNYSEHTPEEVAAIVKRAALFFGASLVGISPLDERWIYSGYYDGMTTKAAPIVISKVEEIALPPGQISSEEAGKLIRVEFEKLEAGKFKALIVDILETTDRSQLPGNLPPAGMVKALPAKTVKEKLTTSTLPLSLLRVFGKRLGLDFEIANIDSGASGKPQYLEDGTLQIPGSMKSVISLAFEMDYEGMKASPTQLGDAVTGDGYSKMAITAGSLARFLMGLGYNAIPCGNNTGLSVPMAIDAGLGELGRLGILITPKFGPRIRLAKVITDLPMAYDKPISFGVKEFCDSCGKCADACPVQAISHGQRNNKAHNISTNPGVMKWPIDAEKCYFSWESHGSGCSVCINVCPFNKPKSWLHDSARFFIGARSGSLDKLFVKLDDALGYGSKKPDKNFWKKNKYMHLKY